MTAAAWCTAKAWRSAWCWRTNSRRARSLCPQEEAERVAAHLAAVGLPTRLGEVPGGVGTADELMAA